MNTQQIQTLINKIIMSKEYAKHFQPPQHSRTGIWHHVFDTFRIEAGTQQTVEYRIFVGDEYIGRIPCEAFRNALEERIENTKHSFFGGAQ